MTNTDLEFMQRALQLAKRGIGSVEPNPAVGCVLVKDGRVIGEGWHERFGGPHAEINALQDCARLGASPRDATMYVTLEPCCHQGKTPPCTDQIIRAGLAKVVVAIVDPSVHAAGKGIVKLQKAGIETRVGLCQAQAGRLNAPFFKYATTGRCWVVLKWAQSLDAKTAGTSRRHWISNEKSRQDVQQLRRRAQAILVGVNTVLADDPLLTARPPGIRPLTRVVLDSRLRLPLDCRLLATVDQGPVIIITTRRHLEADSSKAAQIRGKGGRILAVPAGAGRCNIASATEQLSKQGIAQLLVEGGPTVIASFLREKLADEICVYVAPEILGCHGTADITGAVAHLQRIKLRYVEVADFDGDVRIRGLLNEPVTINTISH